MRILLVTPNSPFDTQYGAQQRSALFHRALSRHGDVDVLLVREGPATRVVQGPQAGIAAALEWCPRAGGLNRFLPVAGSANAVSEALGCALADYDLIASRYLYPIAKLPLPAGVPTLVDLDDFAPLLWSGAWQRRALLDLARQCAGHVLSRLRLRDFPHVLFASPRDRARFGTAGDEVLSNIPMTTVAEPRFEGESNTLVFVGALWYRPNADAMDWFCGAVWPLVRQAMPQARLLIVGAAAPDVRERWNALPGVEAPGFVDDLAAAYAQAAFAISPIRLGGGSNIKVPEALAHGRTCVLTPFSFDGFRGQLVADEHVRVAATAQDFARTCVQLLDDTGLRSRLARAGHAHALKCFSRERFAAVVDAAVMRAVNGVTPPLPDAGRA
ncbi:MAG: glycosyltransferase [Rhodocyclaceae bacterium]